MSKKDIFEKLRLDVGNIFGTLNCVKIISDLESFKKWLKKEHGITNFNDIFYGYRFFLESSIRAFLENLVISSSLDIKGDFVLYRAKFSGIHLSKIPNTCEKIIFIKNINKNLTLIKKSKNYRELKKAISNFEKNIIDVFDKVYVDNVGVPSKFNIGKGDALKYKTMFYVCAFLNDTHRFKPHGYYVSVLNNHISEDQIIKNLEGYKYSLQFVWFSLLGKKYYSKSVKEIHKSKDWSTDYEFIPKFKKNIKRSEDLDSYFGKIQDEIIRPIERKFKISLPFDEILYLKKRVSKGIFKNLLRAVEEPELNEREKLDYKLFWYDAEIINYSESIFSSVPAFITLLMGAVEFKRKFIGEGEKVYVCKFTHPHYDIGNDFTYGVLIEASSSLGIADYSGWLLFFDCCGDYSGFSGTQHAIAEEVIEGYRKKGAIELREITIDRKKFKKYIADKIARGVKEDFIGVLDQTGVERRGKEIIGEARGLVLELITYYTYSKEKEYNRKEVDWNIKKGYIDVKLETADEVVIVECKVDPNNVNMKKEIKKLNKKVNSYNVSRNKRGVFWFWFPPHQKIIDRLNKAGINHKVLSEEIDNLRVWREKERKRIKKFFDKYNDII